MKMIASKKDDETHLLVEPNVSAGIELQERQQQQLQPQPQLPQQHQEPRDVESAQNQARPRKSMSQSNASHSDWIFIKIVARLALSVLRRFWAATSGLVIGVVLFYFIFGGIFAFLLVLFSLSGILYHAGDRLLYHPDQPNTSRVYVPSPSVVGLNFESLYIKGRDRVRLHLFLIKCPNSPSEECPTLLYLHGNAGNIGHRLLNVKGLIDKAKVNVCLLEYRGYGRSDGSPAEDGLYNDAQAGLDFLRSRTDLNADKIVIFGRSLGGAVAVELASRSDNRGKISAVLLENTFTSIPDIAKAIFNYKLVRWMPVWFYKNKFFSKKKVCRISAPTLFLSGLADTLIPSAMMTELFESCGAESKRLARFPHGNHNETWTSRDYYRVINYFLDEIAKVRQPETTTVNLEPPPNMFSDTGSII